MHVQDDIVGFVDLRRHVEHDAREEGTQGHARGRGGGRAGGGYARATRHAGHKELIATDLDDGLLVVNRGDARARKNLHVALRTQRIEQHGEIAGLDQQ